MHIEGDEGWGRERVDGRMGDATVKIYDCSVSHFIFDIFTQKFNQHYKANIKKHKKKPLSPCESMMLCISMSDIVTSLPRPANSL